MLARLGVIGLIALVGPSVLSAQAVPVQAKTRLTSETIAADGTVTKTTVTEGLFYRASSGSYLKQSITRDKNGALIDPKSAYLTEHGVEYLLVYEKHQAMVTPPFLIRFVAAPASEPPPPGGFAQDVVEDIPCVKRPVRLNAKGKPPIEVGYSCVSVRYSDLELKREVTEALDERPGSRLHMLFVLYDIQLNSEPDPKLLDLRDFNIVRLADPRGGPQTPLPAAGSPTPSDAQDPISEGRDALKGKDFATAHTLFAGFLKDHPHNAEALALDGNAFLGLKQYEDAARSYVAAIELNPGLWGAHKNLIIAYAAQGKWKEFDQERALLQDARAKGELGLSPKDYDVVEVFNVGSQEYVVRSYAELNGKFKTRYTFAHFATNGKLDYLIACESDDVDQISFAKTHPEQAAAGQRSFSLDSYSAITVSADGKSSTQTHGTIKFYPDGEPAYETVRADVIKALEQKTKRITSSTTTRPATPDAAPPKPQ